jgi:NodT family efflux transporter outer membrane factor (OMF) lipoprotein
MRVVFAAGLVACLGTGCLHESFLAKPPAPVPTPETFSTGAATRTASSAEGDRWWRRFEDPALEALIERSLADNLELRGAYARLAQADAVVEQATAGMWPQLELQFQATRRRLNPAAFGSPAPASEQTLFQGSLAAGYELDLWGRVRASMAAGTLEHEASRDDLEAVAMSLSAQVADTWFQLSEARSQLELLREQQKVNETFLELVQARFDQGMASALDVLQQRQAVIGARRRAQPVEVQLALLEQQLSVLTGRLPTATVARPGPLPAAPPVPELGVPAELLSRRPDVRAAQRRVEAQDYRVAAAIADRFPSLRLTASMGFQATDLGAFLDGFVWNLVGGLVAPLIDGGRRAAEVDRNRALLEQRVTELGRVLLRALQEVEAALVRGAKQEEIIVELEAELAAARETLEEARHRYLQGLGDYLPVLTALRGLQETERGVLAARRQLLGFRIELFRALGGDWTRALPETTAAADERDET